MGREARKVPPDWKHPTDYAGRLKPLYYGAGARYQEQAEEYLKNVQAWADGSHPSRASNPEIAFWWDYDGDPRTADDFMLVGVPDEACTHFQLYETTTEGTPIGPILATLEEVAAHAAEHASTFGSMTATKEEWLAMLRDGFVYHREGRLIFT